MTLDELEAEMIRRASKNHQVCDNSTIDKEKRSFHCNNQKHSECSWAECKCVCHECEMMGYGMY